MKKEQEQVKKLIDKVIDNMLNFRDYTTSPKLDANFPIEHGGGFEIYFNFKKIKVTISYKFLNESMIIYLEKDKLKYDITNLIDPYSLIRIKYLLRSPVYTKQNDVIKQIEKWIDENLNNNIKS